MAMVYEVLERAPVGPLDRRKRAVRGYAEGYQQGAEPVLRKTEQAPRKMTSRKLVLSMTAPQQ